MTLEQQQALALSRARQRAAQSQPTQPPEQPQGGFLNSAARMANVVSREAAPYVAAGSAAAIPTLIAGQMGPQVALPEEIVTVPAAFLGGMGAYGLSRLFGDPAISATNAVAGTEIPTVSQATSNLLDASGAFIPPDQQTPAERVVGTATMGAADALSGAGVGKQLAAYGAGPVSEAFGKVAGPVASRIPFLRSRIPATADQGARKLGEYLSRTPKADAALGAAGGAAYQGMEEQGGNTAQNVAAGIVAPMALGIAQNVMTRRLPNMIGADNLSAFFGGAADDVRQIASRPLDSMPITDIGQSGRKAAAATQAVNNVAQYLQDQAQRGGGVGQAISNISDAGQMYSGGQVRPDAATLSDNMGLIGAMRGVANDPTVAARASANQAAVGREVSEALPQVGAGPKAAQRFMRGELESGVKAADVERQTKFQSLQSEEGKLSQLQSQVDVSGEAMNRAAASEAALPALRGKDAEMRAVNQKLSDAIPKDTPVNIGNNTKKAAQSAINEYKNRATGEPTEEIQALLKLAQDNPNILSGEAHENFKDLYNLAANAQTQNERRLVEGVRNALRADIEAVPELRDPFKAFNKFYAETYHPSYREGASRDVLIGRKAGNEPKIAPEATLDRFLKVSQMEGGRDAGRLVKALSGQSGMTPKSEKIIGDWMESSISAAIRDSKTADKAAVAKAWMDKHSLILKELPPSAQDRVMKIQSDFGIAQSGVAKAKGEFAASEEALSAAQRKLTDTPEGKFSAPGMEAANNVDKWLYGEKARSTMLQLVKSAKKDKTGRSMEGLKNAVKQSLERKIKNVGSTTEGNAAEIAMSDFGTSFAKMNKILSSEETTKALRQIFSPKEIESLDRIRKKIAVATRINKKATAGSITAYLGKESQSQIDEIAKGIAAPGSSTTAMGASAVRTIKTIKDLAVGLAKTSVIDTDTMEKLQREVLLKALLDPDVAVALLRRPTPENLKTTSSILKPIVRSFMMGQQDGDESK